MTKDKTTTALSTEVDAATLAILADSYPTEPSAQRIMLPRLGLVSQDKTEGKGKSMTVIAEAGTFFTEHQSEEVDENGKKLWDRKELGTSIDAIVLYERKQLKYYDESTEEYTSSPIYDNDDEVLPLWCNKAEVAKGTPAELKKKYEYVNKEGKTRSSLEDNRILYVLFEGEVYQMNLRGSSMYSFMTYRRSSVIMPATVTHFDSEYNEKGTIKWNKMTFSALRPITQEEATVVVGHVQEIKHALLSEKAQYVRAEVLPAAKDDDF